MKCRTTIIKIVLAAASAGCLMWAVAMLYVLFRQNADDAAFVAPVSIDSKPLTEMKIPHRRISIADVRQGDTLRVSYSLVNIGSDSLFLGRINPDCTCTDYVIDSKSAAPGDSLKLELVVNTENRYGENVIRAVIESNTPQQQDLVTLRYTMAEKYRNIDSLVVDSFVRFGSVPLSKEVSYKSKIVNKSSQNVFLHVYTSCRCLRVYPSDIVLPPEGSAEYEVKVVPDFPGEFNEYFVLRKDDGKSLIRVPVEAIVVQ